MAVDGGTHETAGRPEVFSARRRRQSRINSIMMFLAVMLVVIEVNYITFQHLNFRWDFTGKYQVSDRTQILLKSLVSDVNLYCIWRRGNPPDAQVRDVIDELVQYTDKLKITFFDPYIERSDVESLLGKYELSPAGGMPRMLFVRGEKTKLFDIQDMMS
ncbi:hypothetical protein ACFL54_08405 [Planctomycetota bacterium]